MAIYNERLTAPSTTDKNYLHHTKGGYNYCIIISGSSCLPNCVGYAWGRWRELLGKYHNLARTNAENWYGNTADGYKRGQTPKLGAVICWRKGKAGVSSDGAGHVAIVEKINDDGSILISQSAYGGSRFTTKTIKPPFVYGANYTFQGFIYPPVEFEEKKEEEVKIDPARSFNKSFEGTYKTTAALHLRAGAGTSKKSLVVMPQGAKVRCYGYYTEVSGVNWYYLQYGNKCGFSSSQYLKKV